MAAPDPGTDLNTRDYSTAAGAPPTTASGTPPANRPTRGPTPTTRADGVPVARPFLPIFGDYELLHLAGEGGMGVVYQARHRPTGRVIALKQIGPRAATVPELVSRFDREIRAADAARHPNIISIIDAGVVDGCLYYTMPFVPTHLGRKRGDFRNPRAAARLVATLARAVYHAYAVAGVVHRDLKPANILLTADGTPLVADFGLAKWAESSQVLTNTDAPIGTPHYMAPEQVAGAAHEIGPAVDVWALGVILYELVTGQRPFDGGSRDSTLSMIRTAEPSPPRHFDPTVDSPLEAVILKCLRKPPSERYRSAAALADDLEAWLDGRPVRGTNAAGATPVRPPGPTRWRRVAAVAGWAVALCALVLAAAMFRSDHSNSKLMTAKFEPTPVPTSSALREINDQIERGHRVVLVPDEGMPKWHERVDVSPGDELVGTIGSSPTYPQTTVSSGTGFVQYALLPRVPRSKYVVQARVRHVEAIHSHGTVGLYLGHRVIGAGGTRARCCLRLVFNDRVADEHLRPGDTAPRNRLRADYFLFGPQLEGHGLTPLTGGNSSFIPDVRSPRANRFRHLKVAIRPASVDVWFDGMFAGRIDTASLSDSPSAKNDSQRIGAPVDFDPCGGFGLYVGGSLASFQSVSVSPLAEGE